MDPAMVWFILERIVSLEKNNFKKSEFYEICKQKYFQLDFFVFFVRIS